MLFRSQGRLPNKHCNAPSENPASDPARKEPTWWTKIARKHSDSTGCRHAKMSRKMQTCNQHSSGQSETDRRHPFRLHERAAESFDVALQRGHVKRFQAAMNKRELARANTDELRTLRALEVDTAASPDTRCTTAASARVACQGAGSPASAA